MTNTDLDTNSLWEAGIDMHDAWFYFHRHGIEKVADILQLVESPVHLTEVGQYAEAGIDDPLEMIDLKVERVGGYSALRFVAAGIEDLQTMMRLTKHGVDGWQLDAVSGTWATFSKPETVLEVARQLTISGVGLHEVEWAIDEVRDTVERWLAGRILAVWAAPVHTARLASSCGDLSQELSALSSADLKTVVSLLEEHRVETAREAHLYLHALFPAA